MSTYWINAHRPGQFDTVNIRAVPDLKGAIAGKLNTEGLLASLTDETDVDETDRKWFRFQPLDGQLMGGWIRSDVVKLARLSEEAEAIRLGTPYRSQTDSDANRFPNDCGPAALAMVLQRYGINRTVNDVSLAAGLFGRETAHVIDLQNACSFYKFPYMHVRPGQITDIIGFLRLRRPVICLINYEHLRPDETYGHYVVADGFKWHEGELSFYLHDPLLTRNMVYPASKLAAALGRTAAVENMPYQLIVPANDPPPYHEAREVLQGVADQLEGVQVS